MAMKKESIERTVDYYNRGLYYAKKNAYTKASKYVQQHIQLHPRCYKGYNLLGLCLYEMGRIEAAIYCWKTSKTIYDEDNNAIAYLEWINTKVFQENWANYQKAYN